jgi:hypothetical protein
MLVLMHCCAKRNVEARSLCRIKKRAELVDVGKDFVVESRFFFRRVSKKIIGTERRVVRTPLIA